MNIQTACLIVLFFLLSLYGLLELMGGDDD